MADDGALGPPVLAIVGATGSGKSDLALDLAQRLAGRFGGAEVVNADAFQLYRGMDIGTAKVPPDLRRGVPHHQLDVLDIHQDASVAAYQRQARADLAAVAGRGHVPILVGGSGLYVRAALDILDIPPADPDVRQRWESELAQRGAQALWQVLAHRDPAAAAAIDARNARRVVRALEVVELTGRPFAASLPRRQHVRPTVLVGVRLDRAALDVRIGERARDMWRSGLVAEVEQLARAGLAATRTASRAVGYRQALGQLGGELTQEQAIEATAAATRRLARRQESWFGADPRVRWLDHRSDELVEAALRAYERADVGPGPPS